MDGAAIGGIRIGTAGWSIPPQHAADFAGAGSHLDRYARAFSAVEINSSFYRPHRPGTYARWAAAVPEDFHFAVKLPRAITHDARLIASAPLLDAFLIGVRALGHRLGPLLVQLPPSLVYDGAIAGDFCAMLRDRFDGLVVCEPRHPSWFGDTADAMLAKFAIARAAADPAIRPEAAIPGGWSGFTYHRLHGTPDMYASPYPADALHAIATRLREDTARGRESWCIFDNTARGAAIANAATMQSHLRPEAL